MIKNHTL